MRRAHRVAPAPPQRGNKGGEGSYVVATQPVSAKRHGEIRQRLLEINPTHILDWSEQEVADYFLKPVGMDHLCGMFIRSHITGTVLVALREEHLVEMGCTHVGDRLMLMEHIKILKRQKATYDRGRSLWSATTPVTSCAHHTSFSSFLRFVCCPCTLPLTHWKITAQGIRWERTRAATNCTGQNETQFIDYRFMKDIEMREIPRCLCCCVGKELLLYADDKDAVSVRQSASTFARQMIDKEPLIVRHPDARQAERIIRDSWATVELVAD